MKDSYPGSTKIANITILDLLMTSKLKLSKTMALRISIYPASTKIVKSTIHSFFLLAPPDP